MERCECYDNLFLAFGRKDDKKLNYNVKINLIDVKKSSFQVTNNERAKISIKEVIR